MDFKQNFKRTVNIGILRKRNPEIPDGLMKRCKVCRSAVFVEEARQNLDICPRCGTYFRMHARRRIEQVLDEGSFEEWDTDLNEKNPLGYRGYPDKIADLREKTGLDEAVLTGKGRINGLPTVFGVCDSRFLMASMGEVVGEKITRAVERATKDRLPVIFFICSGGARMQEGMTSLMQMAKTAAAFRRHSDAGLLSVNVLTNPTTGGVTASFAMLGDIILAEPGALIGFAGPRVIEQTIGQKLPAGFQSSEFLLEHGFLDGIVERKEMKETLQRILRLHGGAAKIPWKEQDLAKTEKLPSDGKCFQTGSETESLIPDPASTATVKFDKAGTHPMELREIQENGYVTVKKFQWTAKDYMTGINDWIKKLIAEQTNSSMTSMQKINAICAYLRGNFKYNHTYRGMLVELASDPEEPFFISQRWDSLESPAIVKMIAQEIGGFDEIYLYAEDNTLSPEDYKLYHSFFRLRAGAEEVTLSVCPITVSGRLETIEKIDFTNTSAFQLVK